MKVDHLTITHLVRMPENAVMEDGILYVSHRFGLAIHMCACGCRIQTVTPLNDIEHPKSGWSYKEEDGKPTLHPSIGNQQFPCKSHYWVTDGEIVWCPS